MVAQDVENKGFSVQRVQFSIEESSIV
ncbi:unnamed protein product, partial [Rotaria sp. Silwood1]